MSSPRKKMKFTKNKAKFYSNPHNQHQQYLAAGMRGFLATCNFEVSGCVRESYNILNTYADQLYGAEELKVEKDEKSDTEVEIADQLEKEVKACNNERKKSVIRRFQRVETGASNCVFIRTTLDDPVDLASHIVEDIKTSGQQKSRFLLRLVPIESVCRIDDMNSIAGALFDKYFLKQGSTFSIVFNRRFNNDVKRDKVIAELADLVQSKNIHNRVDLKNPEKTVVVEIIKGLCLLSVISGYLQNKKYNLVELARNDKKTNVETTTNEVKEKNEVIESSENLTEADKKDESTEKT